jgi:ribosomal protein S18 acetylase RimI-like enzyme
VAVIDRPVPGPGGHEILKADPARAGALARTLARAFYDDPVATWLVPDDTRRLAVHERAFELFLRRIWLAHGETYVGGDDAGVSVWDPPEAWQVGMGEQLRLMPALARIFGRRLPKALGALARAEKNHPAEPHFYLAFMGVAAESRGRGMGSALMFGVLQRCDAERLGAYLEASSPRNRALYERHGFEVTEELRLGRGSPPLWRMWRAPGAG